MSMMTTLTAPAPPPIVPAGGNAVAASIRARAAACRAERTPLGDLLAEALGRLADQAAWVAAAEPAEVLDRADARAADAGAEAVGRAYDAGYREARLGMPSRAY